MERKDRKSDFKIDIFVCAEQAEELIIVFENKYYKYMKKLCLFTSVLMVMFNLSAQQQVTTFEMRHFKSDAKANGVTDFHGETEVFDTDQRISALYKYADYASKFWGDPNLDKPLFTDDEVRERVAKIKAQPTTSVRRTLSLDNWRAYGYKAGKEQAKAQQWQLWSAKGATIDDGKLVFDGSSVELPIDPIDWRFRIKCWLTESPSAFKLLLGGEGGEPIVVTLDGAKTGAQVDGKTYSVSTGELDYFEVYGDFENHRMFVSSANQTIIEFPISEKFGNKVTSFSMSAADGRASIDKFSFYSFIRNEKTPHMPYSTKLHYDEDFGEVPTMQNWAEPKYDDSKWTSVTLPSAHGGQSVAGESYYLRTKVKVGNFKYAQLDLEAIDPAGEVWINGVPAAVLKGREPKRVDVGEYLIPNAENTIAVRVKPYYAHYPMQHTSSDRNIGWFLGRTKLILTEQQAHITEGLAHTISLTDTEAVQAHKIDIRNEDVFTKKAQLEVNYYPWFPEEGERVASASQEILVRPNVNNSYELNVTLPSPNVWSPRDPQLYRVEVVLKDEKGNPIDDYVTTTGVRIIEQREGLLYINNKPEMLNGAQNFGYRLPLENIAKHVRCATDEQVMRDFMMSEQLGGNMLRIHIHAEKHVSEGVNDPRYAEYADQLGFYILWQSAGWIREGNAFNVDIEHFPAYMKRVYNHPSIVMWEASNHPNRFKQHPFSETEDYFNAIISTIIATDTSRLISPTSFWQHTQYASYRGTRDFKGNEQAANPLLMHRKMTRGSQDAYTGYGAKWSKLRTHPSEWAKDCLEAKDLCYFNFEHEESAAQPNWALARKEPWYKVQSYEWDYEKGSIGRRLQADEWRASQAFQAFSAWESMKIQTMAGVCGFSWCSLESGPNMFTYQKPLVDPFYVPKLAYHANRMAFNRIWAASDDVDVVYGPQDEIRPVIFNLEDECNVNLTVELQNEAGRVVERKVFKNVSVQAGRSVTRLDAFRFRNKREGCYFVVYKLQKIE